jgi:hypothetical protein
MFENLSTKGSNLRSVGYELLTGGATRRVYGMEDNAIYIKVINLCLVQLLSCNISLPN